MFLQNFIISNGFFSVFIDFYFIFIVSIFCTTEFFFYFSALSWHFSEDKSKINFLYIIVSFEIIDQSSQYIFFLCNYDNSRSISVKSMNKRRTKSQT